MDRELILINFTSKKIYGAISLDISEEKANDYKNYIVDKIKQIIDECSPRDCGSQGELKAHEFVKKELEKYLDDVQIESFKVAPKAHMHFLPIVGFIFLLSLVFYWILPLVALLLTLSATLILILQFLLLKKILDPFFPKRTSHNLIGIKKPTKEIKKTIILSGHIDAAYEWRFNKVSPKLLRVILLPAILGLFFKIFTDIFNTIFNTWNSGYQNIWSYLGIIQLFFLPFVIALFFFTDFSKVVPGASDNLSGTIVAVAVAKYLRDEGISFENTEVQYLITGSEEQGLRGSKTYVKKHLKELKETETVFFGLESFRDLDDMGINNRDMNGLVKNHPGVCALIKKAGENCRRELKFQSVYIGATDAAAFSQAGIAAATFEAMNPGPPRWYHTRYDNWEGLNAECLNIAFKIAIETVLLYDKEGLPPSIVNCKKNS